MTAERKKFEYKRFRRTDSSSDETYRLVNELGQEGWELVQIDKTLSPPTLWLKREIIESSNE